MSAFFGRAMLDKLVRTVGGARAREPADIFAEAERAFREERHAAAIGEFQQLAEAGHAEAQYRLGRMYENARGVVQSLPDAVHWYTKAAEAGHARAQAQLGLIYLADPPAPASLTAEAAEYAARGALETESPLVQLFPHGFAIRQDYAAAAHWNRTAAAAGRPDAQARLGQQFALGLGVERDRAQAERWFALAAEQGEVTGQTGLGVLFAGGYDGEADYPKAAKWLSVAAEAGDPVAQYCYGILLLDGDGVDPAPATAVSFFRRAAEQMHASAMHQLGLAYWRGTGVAPDLAIAENWLRRAMAAHHVDSAVALGQLLLSRTDDDGVEAAHWLLHAAEQGNVPAASAIARLHLAGHGVMQDRQEAMRWLDVAASEADADMFAEIATGLARDGYGEAAAEWLERAARAGNGAACFSLASLYRSGRGIPQDMDTALAWYTLAADAADCYAPAAFALGLIYAAGEEAPQDFAAAIHHFRQAADAGHAAARCRLALMTIQGRGVPAAPDEGIGVLEEMAAQGIPEAAETLFELYWSGEGVAANASAAIQWLERAAELGSPHAPRRLAEILDQGEIGPRDPARIFALLEQASAAGNLDAQVDIGRLLLLEGRDGTPDPVEARAWFERAANADHGEAQLLMGELNREGLTGPADPAAAEIWYRRAIANGNHQALLMLAMMLEQAPPERTESHQEAFGLLLVGASAGDTFAQSQVAERYRQGITGDPDEEAAARWHSAAAGRKAPTRRSGSRRISNR